MLLLAFGLKAGLWPLHFWLTAAFASVWPVVALLLGGIPVATGLFGLLRWLPLGEARLPGLGIIIQSIGVAAIVYAVAIGIKPGQLKKLPAYTCIIANGLFVIGLGAGLASATTW